MSPNFLVTQGAKVNERNEFDEAAVDVARLGGHVEFVMRLNALFSSRSAREMR